MSKKKAQYVTSNPRRAGEVYKYFLDIVKKLGPDCKVEVTCFDYDRLEKAALKLREAVAEWVLIEEECEECGKRSSI